MGTSGFFTLLLCVHFVVGSPKSCPDADKPVEVIAMEIGSNEEAVSILGCDSVSVEKGNDLMKSRLVSKLLYMLHHIDAGLDRNQSSKFHQLRIYQYILVFLYEGSKTTTGRLPRNTTWGRHPPQ